MGRATLNIISATDDIRTVIKKSNDNFRQLNKDIHLTEINSGGGGNVQFHNELLGREEFRCHPIDSIEGLNDRFLTLEASIKVIDTTITDIQKTLSDYKKILDDHEERIEELEKK